MTPATHWPQTELRLWALDELLWRQGYDPASLSERERLALGNKLAIKLDALIVAWERGGSRWGERDHRCRPWRRTRLFR